MKKVLVLGAGLVARPLVNYLLNQPETLVTVATRTVKKAEDLINNHPQGIAKSLNVSDNDELTKEIADNDVIISMVPYIHHMIVARICLEKNKHLVTTSYVKDEMQALDQEVKEKGLLFLNEIGLDPGIDHMSAMKTINQVKENGGKITSFLSYCGGLPAPEANDNPFGYKFSWSPRGVVLAAKNSARFLKDGQEVNVDGKYLFDSYFTMEVPPIGQLEVYPNRDSLGYIKKYNLTDAKTVMRGTFRNPGHCLRWKYIGQLGFLDEVTIHDLENLTYRQFLANLIKAKEENLEESIKTYLNLPENSDFIEKLTWLGMLSGEKLSGKNSALDVLTNRLQEKLVYAGGERDMVILYNEYMAEYPENRQEKITSTLIDFGQPHGDTSMAKTVGLPAAIATKLILEGKINLTGVRIPVEKEIYEPVLKELSNQGVSFVEKAEEVSLLRS